MTGETKAVDLLENDLYDEETWKKYYSLLRPLARHFLSLLKVPLWYGQEEDMVEDVVQETIVRILERIQRARCGEATPIHSLEHMMGTIIRNYCIDLNRHDRRLTHILPDEHSYARYVVPDSQISIAERADENLYEEELFTLLAYEIAHFPEKQRTALLIDLANLMLFDNQPTSLQKAFLAVGIALQEYQQPLSADPDERRKHSSLLSIAYRRVAHLSSIKYYIVIAHREPPDGESITEQP